MRTESEIKQEIRWFYEELDGVTKGSILCESKIAAQKYYKGAITALERVLQENNQ